MTFISIHKALTIGQGFLIRSSEESKKIKSPASQDSEIISIVENYTPTSNNIVLKENISYQSRC